MMLVMLTVVTLTMLTMTVVMVPLAVYPVPCVDDVVKDEGVITNVTDGKVKDYDQ